MKAIVYRFRKSVGRNPSTSSVFVVGLRSVALVIASSLSGEVIARFGHLCSQCPSVSGSSMQSVHVESAT